MKKCGLVGQTVKLFFGTVRTVTCPASLFLNDPEKDEVEVDEGGKSRCFLLFLRRRLPRRPKPGIPLLRLFGLLSEISDDDEIDEKDLNLIRLLLLSPVNIDLILDETDDGESSPVLPQDDLLVVVVDDE